MRFDRLGFDWHRVDNQKDRCYRTSSSWKPNRASLTHVSSAFALHATGLVGTALAQSANQKLNLAATCITRFDMAATTWPNEVLLMFALTAVGPKNCALIKRIERFQTHFKHFRLAKVRHLQQGHVPIVHAGAIKEAGFISISSFISGLYLSSSREQSVSIH
jgi:hypothetical protein